MMKNYIGLDDNHTVIVRYYPALPREPFTANLDPCYGNGEGQVSHSPTGFSWGYCGSGPAQLAFAILAHEFGPSIAKRFYQEFKEQVIAKLPNDQDWILRDCDVRAVVEAIKAKREEVDA